MICHRRTFLTALGAAVIATRVQATGGPSARSDGESALYDLVYDQACADALPDFEDLRASARNALAYDWDITSVWQRHLRPSWQKENIATFGITRHTEFYLLSELSKGHGYRARTIASLPDMAVWTLHPDPAGNPARI